MTDAEYLRLLRKQDGHCALCANTPKSRRLHVDHDHSTGAVRGLLCYVCNKYLPASRDAAWHIRAANYLDVGGQVESVEALTARGYLAPRVTRASLAEWRAAKGAP